MNSSELAVLLFATGLPADGYDFIRHAPEERAAMLAAILAQPGITVSELPAVSMVENPQEATIWLVTQAGHFAHPSLLRRALVREGGARSIRVSGFTAAEPDLMARWMEQFRAQDEHTRGSALC